MTQLTSHTIMELNLSYVDFMSEGFVFCWASVFSPKPYLTAVFDFDLTIFILH